MLCLDGIHQFTQAGLDFCLIVFSFSFVVDDVLGMRPYSFLFGGLREWGSMKMILGIDLSSVRLAEKGKTMVAVLGETGTSLRLLSLFSLRDDRELVSLLKTCPFVICGVDAPLSLPPCVLCTHFPCPCLFGRWTELLGFAPEMAYHYRISDLVLRRSLPFVAPKPPLSNGGPVDITPLTMRWLRITRQLVAAGVPLQRIIEVYGSGAIQLYAQYFQLAAERIYHYRASEHNRRMLLEHVCEEGVLELTSVFRAELCENEDAFDALFVALTSWHTFHDRSYTPDMLLSSENKFLKEKGFWGKVCGEKEAMVQFLSKKQWSFLPDLVGGCVGDNLEKANENKNAQKMDMPGMDHEKEKCDKSE